MMGQKCEISVSRRAQHDFLGAWISYACGIGFAIDDLCLPTLVSLEEFEAAESGNIRYTLYSVP